MDVFLRADKNDDGHLDQSEFASFFGVADAYKHFKDVDANSDGSISHDELFKFFTETGNVWKQYGPLFTALDNLNVEFSRVAALAARQHRSRSAVDKFRERFLLREIATAAESFADATAASLHAVEKADRVGRNRDRFEVSMKDLQSGEAEAVASEEPVAAAPAAPAAPAVDISAQLDRFERLLAQLQEAAEAPAPAPAATPEPTATPPPATDDAVAADDGEPSEKAVKKTKKSKSSRSKGSSRKEKSTE
jgi:hypothetical protein